MNCHDIIENWLRENGYDGLFFADECACEIGDLIPCGENFSGCKPGYKIIPPDDVDCECDFYISENKDDKPWEWE